LTVGLLEWRGFDRLDALDRRADRWTPLFVGILLVLALALVAIAVVQRRWIAAVGTVAIVTGCVVNARRRRRSRHI